VVKLWVVAKQVTAVKLLCKVLSIIHDSCLLPVCFTQRLTLEVSNVLEHRLFDRSHCTTGPAVKFILFQSPFTSSSSQRPGAVLAAGSCIPLRGAHADTFAAVHRLLFCSPFKLRCMAPPPHVNTDIPQSLTAPGKGTVPAQSTTATSGSSSVPDRNASKSTVTEPTSTYYGVEGNIGAKLAMDDLLTLISREAKLTPRKEANEQTSAPSSEHQPRPVGVDSLIGLTESSHEKAVAETAASSRTSSWKTMFDGIGTTVGIDLVGVSKTHINKQLPPRWCMQCLACHPYPDTLGSYHIRPLRDNVAMHEAIRMGDLPPVDPWHDVLEALKVSRPEPAQQPAPAPPPAPAPARHLPASRTLAPTPFVTQYLRDAISEKTSVSVDDKMKALVALMKSESDERIALLKNEADERRQNEAQAAALAISAASAASAPSAPTFGSYVSAATAGGLNSTYPWPGAQRMQPTGPPSKNRKRKQQASGEDQRSGHADNNTRFKRRGQRPTQVAGSDQAPAPQTAEKVTTPEEAGFQKLT
jgi:hypothetical protein